MRKLTKKIAFARIDTGVNYPGKFPDGLVVPADMLRYDAAFFHPSDPSVVAFPRLKGKGGTSGGIITHRRWLSFGTKTIIEEIHPAMLDALVRSLEERPEEWITCRHPVSESGGRDYSTFVRQNLREFMEELEARRYSVRVTKLEADVDILRWGTDDLPRAKALAESELYRSGVDTVQVIDNETGKVVDWSQP